MASEGVQDAPSDLLQLQDEHADVEEESTDLEEESTVLEEESTVLEEADASKPSLFEGHSTETRPSRMHMTAASITLEHEAGGTQAQKMLHELHEMAAESGACCCALLELPVGIAFVHTTQLGVPSVFVLNAFPSQHSPPKTFFAQAWRPNSMWLPPTQ